MPNCRARQIGRLGVNPYISLWDKLVTKDFKNLNFCCDTYWGMSHDDMNWIINFYFLEVNPYGQLWEQKGTLERWGMRWVAGLAFFPIFLSKFFKSVFSVFIKDRLVENVGIIRRLTKFRNDQTYLRKHSGAREDKSWDGTSWRGLHPYGWCFSASFERHHL